MYIILNNKKINIINANNFLKRLIGLMFKKKITHGMLFNKCNAIHTIFMKSNIDVVFLDNNNMVIKKLENVKKNRIIKVKNKAKNTKVLELPPNSCKNLQENKKLIIND